MRVMRMSFGGPPFFAIAGAVVEKAWDGIAAIVEGREVVDGRKEGARARKRGVMVFMVVWLLGWW